MKVEKEESVVGSLPGVACCFVCRDFDDTGAEIEKEQRPSGRYTSKGES